MPNYKLTLPGAKESALITVPTGGLITPESGPPSLAPGPISVTDPAGNVVNMTVQYTQLFTGGSVPTGMYNFSGTPGGGNPSYTNWPSPTIASFGGPGVILPVQQAGGTLLNSAGIGMNGGAGSQYQSTLPRALDVVMLTGYSISNLIDYVLAYPQSSGSEDDHYEGPAGALSMTFHPTAGSPTDQVGPYGLATDTNSVPGTIGGALTSGDPGIGYNLNNNGWQYLRFFTNANGMQTYAGPNASSLVLVGQISLAQIQAVKGGSYTIDTNAHVFDTATWEDAANNSAYLAVGAGGVQRQIAGWQVYE